MLRVPSDSAKDGTLKRRKVLKEPARPVALRGEYMSERKTSLVLYPSGSPESPCAYTIRDDDFQALFTVTGRKFGSRSYREVRDETGLPLFDIRREWSLSNAVWVLTLPGSSKDPLVICRRPTSGKGVLTFENMVAAGGKNAEDRAVTISIEKHGRALTWFDVVDGDRRIVEVRESIRHNKSLALLPGRKTKCRPAMDLTIMRGVDISLVSSSPGDTHLFDRTPSY